MKNKKTFLSFLGLGATIFLSGIFFLMPAGVKADYASTISYSCPNGGTRSGTTCSYGATLSGGVYFGTHVNWCAYTTLSWANDAPGCGAPASGYVASNSFSWGSHASWCEPHYDGNGNPTYFCVTPNGNGTPASGYVSNQPFSGGFYATWCQPTVSSSGNGNDYVCGEYPASGYVAASPGTYGGTYTCPSGGTPSGSTCSYPATPAYSCPTGGVLSGTTCITDNGCAASTCNTTTCWNNIAWVPGTKDCTVPPNGCQANTCTGLTCWNNVAWVAGTKNCTPVINGTCNSIVNNGAYTVAEFNPMKMLGDPDGNGTINNADALEALDAAVFKPSDCTLPTCDIDKNGVTNISDAISILKMSEGLTPSKFCASGLQTNLAGNGPWNWNCLGIGGGSSALNCHANVKTDNGCAVNICAPGSNSSLPTTCDNGINPFTPGTKGPNWADQCISTPVTCTADDCGMSIPSATVSCSRIDSSGCMNPTACVGTCAAPALQTCPSCPLRIQSWKEVAP